MMMYNMFVALFAMFTMSYAFMNPSRPISLAPRLETGANIASSSQTHTFHAMKSVQSSRPGSNSFGSKILPVYTDEELDDLFRELNITRVDLQNDPEILKWSPTKEFFERYGFQNNTERYKRKVSDVKADFYVAYTKPILPQYKTFIADMMTVVFVQIMDSRFKYDALHAFGLCTQYYTVMKGYPMQEEIDIIFNEFTKAIGLDATKLRDDAKRLLNFIKESSLTEDDVLGLANKSPNELTDIFSSVRTNRFFKYTDAWGVGLGRLMELVGVEPNATSFERWCTNLRFVYPTRLTQTWDEFCGDQIRMQGVEAMQKQILIREKKRAAARLEKKAADFEDKKKALMELNQALLERRQELIEEERKLLQKYDPDGYERLMKEEEMKKASNMNV